MVKISEAAKRRAWELAMSVAIERGKTRDQASDWMIAFQRVLQEHSDVAKRVLGSLPHHGPVTDVLRGHLAPLILPDDPDKVQDAIEAALPGVRYVDGSERLHAELAKRGLQIVEAGHD